MQEQILELNISTEAILDPTSPQYQALDWLVHSDRAKLNVRETEWSILIDRYALAVLFYSTNGPEWTFRGGYLFRKDTCGWGGIVCDVLNSITAIVIRKSF